MPLGDPHGGNFTYTVEGLPLETFIASVPSADPVKASAFYRDVLLMKVLMSSPDEVIVRRARCTLRLYKSDNCGVDTGIFIGVEDTYDFHRRMIDEGVRFKMDPKRLPMGVATSFFDNDDNVLYAIETLAVPCEDDKNESGDEGA
ncbi:MAG: glyoxalase [Thermoplasmata archaeon]|nr:glyoxalase [Thermoplasmata archaeon]